MGGFFRSAGIVSEHVFKVVFFHRRETGDGAVFLFSVMVLCDVGCDSKEPGPESFDVLQPAEVLYHPEHRLLREVGSQIDIEGDSQEVCSQSRLGNAGEFVHVRAVALFGLSYD